MQILGIKLTVFAALIAALGAAAGLALSGTLQNFASGVLLLLLKPFKVGDNILAQGLDGTVTSIQIFYTVINTFDNRTVIMPNSKLSNEVIINITYEKIRRLDIEIELAFATDVEKVKELLQHSVTEYPEVFKDPPPRVGVSAITMNSYKVMISLWIKAHGFQDARLMLNERIIKTLQAIGVYK